VLVSTGLFILNNMQHFSLNALGDTDDFDCLTFLDLPPFISTDNLTGRIFNWVYR